MQSAVLHDPMRVSTPSQRLRNAERIARQARIDEAARRVVPKPVVVRPYQPFWEKPVEKTSIAPDETPAQWAERQKQIPLPEIQTEFKETWFSIVDEIEPSEPRKPTVDQVLRVVAKRYNLSKIDILSQRRTQNLVRPRMIAIYLTKTMTLRSLPDIGRRMGDRDHTTILHSVRKIQKLVDRFPAIAADLESLKAEIQAGLS